MGSQAEGVAVEVPGSGARFAAGDASWTLRLESWSHGEHLQMVSAAEPRAQANRVDLRRGPVTEWYVNGPLGLEQGFTLHEPPPSVAGAVGPLTLALAQEGLAATVDADGRGLSLAKPDGTAALRYRGLVAHDAAGRELRAWLEAQAGRLLIRVEDEAARYPLVVDPFVEQATLTASDGSGLERVAISGDTVVAGGYVFVEPAGGWSGQLQEQAKLTASDGADGDGFGESVAISGDTVVVGAPYHDIDSKTDQGSA